MPDELAGPESIEPQVMAPVETVVPNKGNKGLFIVLGALAALALIGVVVAVLVLSVFRSAVNEVEVRVPEGQPVQQGGSVVATSGVETALPAGAVSNDEVFTFRDIFAPLVGAVTPVTSPTEAEVTDPVTPGEYSAGTLYLVSIGTEDGADYASMIWDGKTYKLNEGEAIPGTPWKVLEIRTSDVVMLYGDQQVVLSVGQGISK